MKQMQRNENPIWNLVQFWSRSSQFYEYFYKFLYSHEKQILQ